MTDPQADQEIAALLDRVRRLEEIELAREHAYAYAVVLDDPVPEEVAALFTEDGVLRTRFGTHRGRAEIAGFYRERAQADPGERRHFMVNPRAVVLEPGLVRVTSQFLFTARAENRSVVGWGRYEDLVRVDGGAAWFAEKLITVEVGTDLGAGWPA